MNVPQEILKRVYRGGGFPLAVLSPIVKAGMIRGLKTQPVLGGNEILLLHPAVSPCEWRALVGVKR